MRLNNDVPRERNGARDGGIITQRNGRGIEKAAAIIKLELPRLKGPARQSKPDLLRNRAERNSLRKRALPEITHQTAPGALFVRKQDSAGLDDFTRSRPFLFEKKTVWFEWVEAGFARRALRHDPIAIAGLINQAFHL